MRSPGDDEVVNRLRAELYDTSWNIVEIRLGADAKERTLVELGKEQHAAAAVKIDVEQGRVELWIKHAPEDIEETIESPEGRLSSWVLALRTTETLRARGLDLGAQPARSAPAQSESSRKERPRSKPPTPRKTHDDRSVRAGLAVGATGSGSPGGTPAQLQMSLSADFTLETWRFSAFGMLPLGARSLDGPEGEADATLWLAGAAIDRGVSVSPNVALAFGSGFMLSVYTFDGNAAPGYRGLERTLVTGVPHLRTGVWWDIAPAWQIVTTAFVGVSVPEVRVQFASREVAAWGRPLVGVILSLRTRL